MKLADGTIIPIPKLKQKIEKLTNQNIFVYLSFIYAAYKATSKYVHRNKIFYKCYRKNSWNLIKKESKFIK